MTGLSEIALVAGDPEGQGNVVEIQLITHVGDENFSRYGQSFISTASVSGRPPGACDHLRNIFLWGCALSIIDIILYIYS